MGAISLGLVCNFSGTFSSQRAGNEAVSSLINIRLISQLLTWGRKKNLVISLVLSWCFYAHLSPMDDTSALIIFIIIIIEIPCSEKVFFIK